MEDWFRDLPFAITLCDTDGILLDMNRAAETLFQSDGGRALLGTNVLSCHPEPARRKLQDLMANQRKNIYTVEKDGKKYLVYQGPWYREEQYAGFVELMFEIPVNLPNFVRD